MIVTDMVKEKSERRNKIISKRPLLIGGMLAIIAVAIIMLFISLSGPERSVENYCKVYKEENEKLASAQGDTYGVTVFSHKSSNPADFANAFTELEGVAPDEIQSDVKSLQQIFQKIDDDPSQALNASLSGLSAESSVENWTSNYCTN